MTSLPPLPGLEYSLDNDNVARAVCPRDVDAHFDRWFLSRQQLERQALEALHALDGCDVASVAGRVHRCKLEQVRQ